MEVKAIPENVLIAARKWFRDWGCEVMYYAGEEAGLYYFNGRQFDMSGKVGFGTPVYVTESGSVHFIRQHLLSCEVFRNARDLNLPYEL